MFTNNVNFFDLKKNATIDKEILSMKYEDDKFYFEIQRVVHLVGKWPGLAKVAAFL